MKTTIAITTNVISKNFFGQVGKGLTMIHDTVQVGGQTVSGPKSFQLKTSDLDEFVEMVTKLRDSYRDSLQLESSKNQ